MGEWNADAYHQLSNPMLAMALPVLARLPLAGNEVVLDVGCGTGLVTEKLAERVPGGRVIAVDLSDNMIRTAREYLRPRVGDRVSFVRADAAALPFNEVADGIFSTATFHWVLDHPALFRSLFRALKPGGRLVAQCGGGPNIQDIHDRAAALMQEPEFAPYFRAWREPWEFAYPETTRERLEAAGFTGIVTGLEAAPVTQPDAGSFAEYLTNIICRHHLEYLPNADAKGRFVHRLTSMAAADDPPFVLGYWRLNIEATRPVERA